MGGKASPPAFLDKIQRKLLEQRLSSSHYISLQMVDPCAVFTCTLPFPLHLPNPFSFLRTSQRPVLPIHMPNALSVAFQCLLRCSSHAAALSHAPTSNKNHMGIGSPSQLHNKTSSTVHCNAPSVAQQRCTPSTCFTQRKDALMVETFTFHAIPWHELR